MINKYFQRTIEIFSIIVIAAISLYLLEKNPIVFDLTKNQKYTVDKKIIELLNSLEDNVYVKVFYDKGSSDYNNISEVLRNLSRYSNKIKVSYIDPRKDIVTAQLYGFSSSNQVLIIYKDRKKFENTIDNEKFANIVSNLLRQKKGQILFTTGHKEPSIDDYNQEGLSSLVKSFRDEGLTVENINLATDNIYNPLVLFVVGPKVDLSEFEIKKIKDYLYDGGKLVVALKNYEKSKFRNLDKLIREFGIDVQENFIIGLDPNNLAVVVSNVVNLPYLSALANVNFYMLNPLVINRIDNVKDVSLSEVLVAKGIMITQDMKKNRQIVVSKDLIKDYTVAMMSERIFKDKKSNILVIGDYGMLVNALVNAGENTNFVLAIIDYFSGNESGFVFKPKDIPDLPIVVPTGQQLALYVIYLLIPFGFLFLTLFFIVRRRVSRSSL
ncbi:MAG: Gldg family protein [Candidatus Calescibacterium sp.]|nr:GldG family protein [Candidatus Calescibacterium sp.]MDW8132036.1 Gldg family protein [Candidatus Calescibacterium sp.]